MVCFYYHKIEISKKLIICLTAAMLYLSLNAVHSCSIKAVLLQKLITQVRFKKARFTFIILTRYLKEYENHREKALRGLTRFQPARQCR